MLRIYAIMQNILGNLKISIKLKSILKPIAIINIPLKKSLTTTIT
jgi:hypothetical protein